MRAYCTVCKVVGLPVGVALLVGVAILADASAAPLAAETKSAQDAKQGSGTPQDQVYAISSATPGEAKRLNWWNVSHPLAVPRPSSNQANLTVVPVQAGVEAVDDWSAYERGFRAGHMLCLGAATDGLPNDNELTLPKKSRDQGMALGGGSALILLVGIGVWFGYRCRQK